MLENDARALISRLDRIQPFALHETMVAAAGPSPAAMVGIERFLLEGRREMRRRTLAYIKWLNGPGAKAAPDQMQRRFVYVRMRFNDVLSQFDLFNDAVTQRSETEIGVYLSGLDVAAADALRHQGKFFSAPPVLCYLDRGPGAAIRRARTRLPGGGENPVALIRVPRERMVGHGIASSLVHEVGHQVAALIDLVPSLKSALAKQHAKRTGADKRAWQLFDRWISEIVADFWSVSRIGIGSTLGLMSVVSLPQVFVFRINYDDPHPTPWVRVVLSATLGAGLYPHPQWPEISDVWRQMYPLKGAGPKARGVVQSLQENAPAFVQFLLAHRPKALRGRSLGEVGRLHDRTPESLDRLVNAWGNDPSRLSNTAPCLALAMMGQARTRGSLTPEREAQVVRQLLNYWALRSTLDTSARLVAGQRVPGAPVPAGRPRALATI